MKGRLDPHISHIKNSQQLRSKGTLLLCVLVLFTVIFVLVPTEAYAFGWGDLKNAVIDGLKGVAGSLLGVIVGGIMWLLNWVGLGLLWLSVNVIKASIEFIFTVGYTPLSNSDTSAISIAWGVVRDLANMSMIIILVLIGVGTILGLSPKGKALGPKLLFPLVAVALLINFTPVLTGMLIDLSNILAKFFFDEAFGGANAFISHNPFNGQNSTGGGNLLSVTDLAEVGATVLEYTIALVFNLTTALILFTLSLLLIMRVLALQLLVIFSPLAFAAEVLPQSRDIFKKWWDQFIQWLILPTVFGFFLWLAILILVRGGNECVGGNVGFDPDTVGNQNSYAATANNILGGNQFCLATVMLMSLAVIIVGMGVAFATSARGASFIINRAEKVKGWVKEKGRDARGYARRKSVETAQSVSAPALNKGADILKKRAGGRVNAINDYTNERIRWGQNQKGLAGALKRFGAKTTRGAVKGTVGAPGKVTSIGLGKASSKLRGPGSAVEERRKKEREQEMRDMQNFTPEQLRGAAFDASKDHKARVPALAKLIQQEENLDRPTAHAIIDTLQDQSIDDAEKSWLLETILSSKNGDDKINSLYLTDGEIQEQRDNKTMTKEQETQERAYNARQTVVHEIIEKSKQRKDGMAQKMLEKFPQYVSNPEEFKQWARTVNITSLRRANSAGLRQALLEPKHSEVLKELFNNNPHIKDANARTLENILFSGVKEREERELAEQILQETTDYKMRQLGIQRLAKQQKGRDILFEVLENNPNLRESIQQNSFDEEDNVWQSLVNIAPGWGDEEQQDTWMQAIKLNPRRFSDISTGGLQYFQTQKGGELLHRMFKDTNVLQPKFISRLQVNDPDKHEEVIKAISMLVDRNSNLTTNDKRDVAKYLAGDQGEDVDNKTYNDKVRGIDQIIKRGGLASMVAATLQSNQDKIRERQEEAYEAYDELVKEQRRIDQRRTSGDNQVQEDIRRTPNQDTTRLRSSEEKLLQDMDNLQIRPPTARFGQALQDLREERQVEQQAQARQEQDEQPQTSSGQTWEQQHEEEVQRWDQQHEEEVQKWDQQHEEEVQKWDQQHEEEVQKWDQTRPQTSQRPQTFRQALQDLREERQAQARQEQDEEDARRRQERDEEDARRREAQEGEDARRREAQERARRLEDQQAEDREGEEEREEKENPWRAYALKLQREYEEKEKEERLQAELEEIEQRTPLGLRGQRKEVYTDSEGNIEFDEKEEDRTMPRRERVRRKEQMRSSAEQPSRAEQQESTAENLQRIGEGREQAEDQRREAVNDRLAEAERRGRMFNPTPDEIIQREDLLEQEEQARRGQEAREQEERDQIRERAEYIAEPRTDEERHRLERADQNRRWLEEQEVKQAPNQANNGGIDDIEPRPETPPQSPEPPPEPPSTPPVPPPDSSSPPDQGAGGATPPPATPEPPTPPDSSPSPEPPAPPDSSSPPPSPDTGDIEPVPPPAPEPPATPATPPLPEPTPEPPAPPAKPSTPPEENQEGEEENWGSRFEADDEGQQRVARKRRQRSRREQQRGGQPQEGRQEGTDEEMRGRSVL